MFNKLVFRSYPPRDAGRAAPAVLPADRTVVRGASAGVRATATGILWMGATLHGQFI